MASYYNVVVYQSVKDTVLSRHKGKTSYENKRRVLARGLLEKDVQLACRKLCQEGYRARRLVVQETTRPGVRKTCR